ncbi:MAG: peptidylprolyl isomerase [Planctomycetes bacterium]|nr:peptidylprolyl isomerase [Planctomycetota bacterium]
MIDPRRPLRLLALGLFALTPAIAQELPPTPPAAPAPEQARPKPPQPAEPHFIVRRYPRDKDVAVAVVGHKTLTLGDLINHMETRHYPGFAKLVEKRPEWQRYLTSDLIAPWVRQLADIHALLQSIGDTYLDPIELETAQSASLKASFESWLKVYVQNLQNSGRPTELSQERVDRLLADFQLKHGLAAELQGMLDVLEKDDYSRGQLQAFFNDHARYFGGQVTVAHILVQHRDAGTGILLEDEGIARANARIAEIKAQLRPDGSNFEEVARLYSDDTRTAKEGGLLGSLHRFDDRMPATLCREAWALRDGDISADVVETQYGYHFVKRLDFNQQVFVLFTDDAIPSIRIVMRRAMQEDRLLGAREKMGVRLLL